MKTETHNLTILVNPIIPGLWLFNVIYTFIYWGFWWGIFNIFFPVAFIFDLVHMIGRIQ